MGFFGGCAMSAPAAMSVLGANSGHLLPGRRGGRLAVVALDSQVHSRPQLLVLGAIGLTGAYWWFVLVPSARVRLAVNKNCGTSSEGGVVPGQRGGMRRTRWKT